MPKLTPFQRNGIDQLIADVLKKNKQHLKGPLSTWEAVEAFAAAVNWTEPFMLSILGFHFTYLLLAVFTRRIWWAQLILMFAACKLMSSLSLSLRLRSTMQNLAFPEFDCSSYPIPIIHLPMYSLQSANLCPYLLYLFAFLLPPHTHHIVSLMFLYCVTRTRQW